jgi:hypothetical protein
MININSILSKKDLQVQEALKSLLCRCGCNRFKGKSYPVCQEMDDLSFLGSGILLFFLLVKGLVIGTGVLFAVYCLFALAMYSQGTAYIDNPPNNCKTSYCDFKNKFSSYNENNPSETFFILDWVGLGVMVFWIIISRMVKYYG